MNTPTLTVCLRVLHSEDKRNSRAFSIERRSSFPRMNGLLSCDYKLAAVTQIINYGLDAIIPVRSLNVQQTDRPWLNAELKRLVQKRQKAFSSGDTFLFKLLRNKVNREKIRCRAIDYNNKVRDLKNTRPRDWWREVITALWKWR